MITWEGFPSKVIYLIKIKQSKTKSILRRSWCVGIYWVAKTWWISTSHRWCLITCPRIILSTTNKFFSLLDKQIRRIEVVLLKVREARPSGIGLVGDWRRTFGRLRCLREADGIRRTKHINSSSSRAAKTVVMAWSQEIKARILHKLVMTINWAC